MHARVSATDAARGAIEALTRAHGRLMFFQSGGCCDGSSPICLPETAREWLSLDAGDTHLVARPTSSA
jgi:uncharacterized protein (DUF779 family)